VNLLSVDLVEAPKDFRQITAQTQIAGIGTAPQFTKVRQLFSQRSAFPKHWKMGFVM
jgi:hypothetical protein